MVHITRFPMLNLLYFYISIFQSMDTVPSTTVFCSSLVSCFPGMLLRYFLNYFEMVTVATLITGITFVFTCHMHCIALRVLLRYFLNDFEMVTVSYLIVVVVVVVVVIVVVVALYFLHAKHLHIYLRKACFCGIQCCSCFVFTTCGTFIAIFRVKYFVLLY